MKVEGFKYFMTIIITISIILILLPYPSHAEKILYTYNSLNQLIRVKYLDFGVTITYTYDKAGNRTSQSIKKGAAAISDILLSTDKINFGATTAGHMTSAQQFHILNLCGNNCDWSITDNADWLSCSLNSGTGDAVIFVSIDPSGLLPGTYSAVILITPLSGSETPQIIYVSLTVKNPSATEPPFGFFETPIDGAVGIYGEIPVSGWVLDDIETTKVEIWREPVAGETTSSDNGLVCMGKAVRVEDARPDVEQLYPFYPANNKSGWGYMISTNLLPNQGNGTYKIHAIASDIEGHSVKLGTKTINCENTHSLTPFGTIELPAQEGEILKGDYINIGWVLAPYPNYIPSDGSTINVWIDGVNVGHPAYNQYRNNIMTLFPGLANSEGAEGYFLIDTTAHKNGMHTISWSVRDNVRNIEGIGARYFTIFNEETTGEPPERTKGQNININTLRLPESIDQITVSSEPINLIRGYSIESAKDVVDADADGVIQIEIKKVERVELDLGEGVNFGCFMSVDNKLRPSPIGSILDPENGIFTWQPGPGFIGEYEFVFVKENNNGKFSKHRVRIIIKPKFESY